MTAEATLAPAAPPPPPSQPAPPPLTPQAPPRWGLQASFIQRRQPAFWLFAILLAITALINLSQQSRILQSVPTAWIFSLILLAIWLAPVILAIYLLDQFEREPIPILVAAFLWGAVVSIGLALITNTAWFEILFKLFGAQFVQDWGPAFIGPPIEETIKYLGLILIYLVVRSEIDDLFDGFIYGALIGLGFATVENVTYFVNPVLASGGGDQIGPVIQMYMLRVLFSGFYMHVLWTGLTGIGLAYYVTRTDQPHQRRLLVAAGMFAAGVLSHFVWNSPFMTQILAGNPGPIQMFIFGLLKGAPFLVFLGVLLVLAQRRERRWFEIAASRDVGSDALTVEELPVLGDMRQRFSARRQARRTHGPAAAKTLGRLQRAQINLAMIRTRVQDDHDPDLATQRELIRRLRAELAAIPQVPVAPVAPPAPTLPTPTQPAPIQPAATQPAPTTAPAMPTPTPVADVAPAAPAPPPVVQGVWTPTHRIGETGQLAWSAPDPRLAPTVTLAPRLDVRVAESSGDWARVVAVNGWTGWVDARLLLELAQ